MRRILAPGLLALLLVAPSHADPSKIMQQNLFEAGSPAELRGKLLRIAAKSERNDPRGAGEAHYYRGLSFERGGNRDSAIASYRLALALRGEHEDRLALVDGLLHRRDSSAVSEAVRLLEPARPAAQAEGGWLRTAYDSRLAWALTLAGHADSADALYRPHENQLTRRPEWRYRIARMALGLGDDGRAFKLLFPLAVASRGQDEETMKALREIGGRMGFSTRLNTELDRAVAARDRLELDALQRMGGRRSSFTARDNFRLGGVTVVPEGKGPYRAAVVIMAPGDTIADYDSLAVGLREAGFALMLLDPRGSGWSLAPACPSPDTWDGREEQLHRLVARDVRTALAQLAQLAPVDTTHYLVGGVGAAASMAIEAADLDRRVGALLLVSPKPALVERGPMRARLAKLQIPAFYQVGPIDNESSALTEAFYQAGNRPVSRVADARYMGTGAIQFRYEPAVRARLMRWLDETMPRSGRRAAQPSRPPGG